MFVSFCRYNVRGSVMMVVHLVNTTFPMISVSPYSMCSLLFNSQQCNSGITE